MKNCSRHTHALMEALDRKGMKALFKPERAPVFVQEWLAGQVTTANFDPYVAASLEVQGKAIDLGVCNPLQDRYTCPFCAIDRQQKKDVASWWIDNVSDAMYVTALQMGMIKSQGLAMEARLPRA